MVRYIAKALKIIQDYNGKHAIIAPFWFKQRSHDEYNVSCLTYIK